MRQHILKINIVKIIKSSALLTFIKVLIFCLTFLSGWFLVKSTLSLSPNDILQSLKIDYFSIEKGGANLAQTNADAKVGFYLLLISFLLQIMQFFIPATRNNEKISRLGISVALIATIVIGIISFKLDSFISLRIIEQIKTIYAQEELR